MRKRASNASTRRCGSESTRSVRRRAPEITGPTSGCELTGASITCDRSISNVPAVINQNSCPPPEARNCPLISRVPVPSVVTLLQSHDKSADKTPGSAHNCNNYNFTCNYKQLAANQNATSVFTIKSDQRVDNSEASIHIRSSACDKKCNKDPDNLKAPALIQISIVEKSAETSANEKQQRDNSHLFVANNNININNNSYTQSDFCRVRHRLPEKSTGSVSSSGLEENSSNNHDRNLASAAFNLRIIEGEANYCDIQNTCPPVTADYSRNYSSLTCPKMNNCFNFGANCVPQLQQQPLVENMGITYNHGVAPVIMDSRQHFYFPTNHVTTKNDVISNNIAASCPQNAFAAALIHHDYGQQSALNGGAVLQNITNSNKIMTQVNNSYNNPATYLTGTYNKPIAQPQQPQETACNANNNLSYNSEDSLSDKENNFINIAKMDSSYFSLSTDDLSNQSGSTNSGCTSSATRMSRVSSEGFTSCANSNSCEVESDIIEEEELPDEEEDIGDDVDNGVCCASDGSCDCDLDGLKESMTYNDENKSYDASGDSESDVSNLSSEDDGDEDDRENTISSFHFEGAVNQTYIDQDISFKTRDDNATTIEANAGGPLSDVTNQYTSSDLNLYHRMIQDRVNGGNQAKTKELTPVTTSDATMMSNRGINVMKPKTNVKPLPPCGQTMTPDTIAATRQIMADSPLTPTTKMSNLTMKPVELFCPIPSLNWGDNWACWQDMIANDDMQYRLARDPLAKHPRLTKEHRTIVLEWLSEVTLHYHMRKDSFYVAVNFFDRFLAATNNLGSDKLQLLGATALFTASKIEEIYPPPSKEFANITNGVCDVEDLVETEICMVKCLNWKMNPVTSLQWLLLYLQLYLYSASDDDCLAAILALASGDRHKTNNIIVNPTFEPMFYHKATCILDLCTLAHESTEFPPRVLAAAVILSLDFTFMRMFSYLDKTQLQKCFYWLRPFVSVASKAFDQETLFKTRYRNNIMLHIHTATMEHFQQVQALAAEASNRALFVSDIQSSPFGNCPNVPIEVNCHPNDKENKDNNLFSLNPADQINMVLLSPPYDS